MPKSAASAHMTTATLLLVAAALSFAGFPATLNLPCPPRSTTQGTLCNRQRRYLHHPGPSGRSPGFPDPPTPSTSTGRKYCAQHVNRHLAARFPQPSGPTGRSDNHPGSSTRHLSVHPQPRNDPPQPSYAHAKTRHLQPHTTWPSPKPRRQPDPKAPTRPESRFFFGTELCILLPSGMTKAPRFLQNRSFPLE